MMAARVALCMDEATCRNPEIAGLDDEPIAAQEWLDVYSTGDEARRAIGQDEGIEEAWVVSADDVEPINLAATLKADRPDLRVRLVAFDGCGSLFSRAHTALIDEVADRAAFMRIYAEAKATLSQQAGGKGRAEAVTPTHGEGAALAPSFDAVATESAVQALAISSPLPAQPAGHAFVMPVVSGSGGAGKSSVAVLSAHIARNRGYRTLLLDYDLQFGDAAVLAGVENALAIDVAMAHPDQLEREVRRDPGLAVLAAPDRLESADAVVRAMPQFLESIAGSFDVIVANTGAAWADQHAVLLERSSAALFLIDQRASSVRACRHALELCARCGIASGPFHFAVNRCSKNAPLTSADVSSALQGAPVLELRDGGRDVEDYLGGGAAADLIESGNELCASLGHVLDSLVPGALQRASGQLPMPDEHRAQKRRGRHVGRKWGRSQS